MIDHHHHLFLVALVHRGRADIELVHQLAFVVNDEPYGFSRFYRDSSSIE